MDIHTFLQRAQSARQWPTLYLLGKGGYTCSEQTRSAATERPGRDVDPARELAVIQSQRPRVYAAYMDALQKSGLTLETLPRQACDCSGFVCWALGVARDSGPWESGWIDTNHIYADAEGAGQLFRTLERAVPGALLVYPKPAGQGPDGPPGHVGIVTQVDADGRAARVLHCAPDNLLLAPQAGWPSSAITETGPEVFEAVARTRVVMWRALDR